MIYLDNAATTPIHPDVLEAMQPFLTNQYGNPSSTYRLGRQAKHGIERARDRLADWLGCHADELVFTSGGTESIQSALLGTILSKGPRRHIVTAASEHHAVLHTCAWLESLGATVTVVQPDRYGRVHPEAVRSALRADTLLVPVQGVNNELGTVQPVADITRTVKDHLPAIVVHSDLVQTLGTRRLNLATSELDLASFSAHKVSGPKGTGALYVRRGTPWHSVLRGGAQERDRRAGTENVAGVVGFGAAVERLARDWSTHLGQLERVRAAFVDSLQGLDGLLFNSPEDAVPAILNVAFAGVHNDTLLMRLDMEDVAASAGSACAAGSLQPSHVLLAAGLPEEQVRASVRFSFSDLNTEVEVRRAGVIVADVVRSLGAHR